MNRYSFTVSDLRIQVVSPRELNIPENFQAFLCPEFPDREADISIEVCFENRQLPKGVLKRTETCYQFEDMLQDYFLWRSGEYIVRTQMLDKSGSYRLSIPLDFADAFCENSNWLLYWKMERMLLPFNRLILHASAVIYKGKAYLFSAQSGGGKSTHAALWKEHYGAILLNGDKVILEQGEKGWIAHGSPIAGSSGVYCNESAPVAAIILLEKAPENELTQISGSKALLQLYSEAVKSSWDEQFNRRVLELTDNLRQQHDVYRLRCLPERSAVDCILRKLEGMTP